MRLLRGGAVAMIASALTVIPGGAAHAAGEIDGPIVIDRVETPTVRVADCSVTALQVTFENGDVDTITGPQVTCTDYPEFML